MSDNVIPFPQDLRQWHPARAVPCPTNSLVTYLTLLDGRLVDERHEILVSGSPDYRPDNDDDTPRYDRYDGYDASCARLEGIYGRGGDRSPQPTPQQTAARKVSALREFVGGQAALAGLDDALLQDADDLRIAAQRPWMPAVDQVDDLIAAVAHRWFDAETLVALQRAMLVLLDRQEPCVQAWSAALTVGATVWAVGKANGLLGPQKVVQRDVLHSLGIETWISQQGATAARLLRAGTGVGPIRSGYAAGPWGYQDSPVSDVGIFQKLTPLGRPELLLGSTRALVIRLRDQVS